MIHYKILKDHDKSTLIEKNNEEINLIFKNIQSYRNFNKNIQLQNKIGVMNKSDTTPILKTMDERNSNWVLLDNNLNFIQCFDDKTYYPLCDEARQRFMRYREQWSIGKITEQMKVKLIPSDDEFDFRPQIDDQYKHKIYILDSNQFVYIREVPPIKVPSELLYLFYKSRNNSLYLHTTFNKSWLYD